MISAQSSNKSGLDVLNLCKSTATAYPILDRLTFSIPANEYACLVGPSGAGKTTLFNILAGFIEPNDGSRILFSGTEVTATLPRNRPFHTVFQDGALFPHLSVRENVEFALRIKQIPAAERRERTNDMLAMIGLDPNQHGHKKPDQLSGGEKRRVAVARALVDMPQMVLLDEPLTGLDAPSKRQLRALLHKLQRATKAIFLHITHDLEDIHEIDNLLVLIKGRLRAAGKPADVIQHPPDPEVAEFIAAAQ